MMRYKKTVTFNKKNLQITLETDMGQTWRATPVNNYNQFTVWLQAHHTLLREYQRDMLEIIHQAYNPETGLNPIELYWVYPKGHGYQQQNHGVALANIPSKNIWVLMTDQNTWIYEKSYDSFSFTIDDASGPVTDETTRDEIWDWRDFLRYGKTFPKRKYNDQDYVNKGVYDA